MCRILIVDDEKQFCTLLERALRHDGLQLQATSDSRVAARLLADEPFELLITDIDMRVPSGFDLARQARKLPRPPALLLITAQKQLLNARFDDLPGAHFLLKPFHLSDLRAKVALLTDCWHIFHLDPAPQIEAQPTFAVTMDKCARFF